MNSDQPYTYKNPIYLQPIVHPVKYEDFQQQNYQNYQTNEINLASPVEYETNQTTTFGEYVMTNQNYQENNMNYFTQDYSTNQNNQYLTYGEGNQIDSTDITNQYDLMNTNNQYIIDNNNVSDYTSQINTYNQYNQNEIVDTENYIDQYNQNEIVENQNYINQYNQYNEYSPTEEENQINAYFQEYTTNINSTNDANNIIYQPNELNNNLEIQQNLNENNSKVINQVNNISGVNKISQEKQQQQSISVDFSLANDKSGVNKINKVYTGESSEKNVLVSIKTVKSIKHQESNDNIENENENEQINEKEQENIDSPRLVSPLSHEDPPSPILISKQLVQKENSEEIISNKEEEKNNLQKKEEENFIPQKEVEDLFPKKEEEYILPKKEENNILPNKEKELFSKDFNIKTHYNFSLMKEEKEFNYQKVYKIAVPLLAHYEMPENSQFKSPLLSPNGKYFSCIAKGAEDYVFVWDINDLYWFKYKFSSSRVDGISFTPDSKYIIIVYRYSNPVMYNLSNGEKVVEFEKNGEENKREGFHCSYTTTGTHFAYTSDKSFTLWSLRTGEIRHQILNDSPIKIICNENLICISNDLNVEIMNITNQKKLANFKLRGVEFPNEILDAKCTADMSSFLYVIKQGIIRYIFYDKEYKAIQKFLSGVENARISDDCRYVLKTNMKNLTIYDLEKDMSIYTIIKDKFRDFQIYFKKRKLIVIDDISINIQDYNDEGSPEQYIWLDKNPTKFEDIQFSRDYKYLFARIDRNNAVAYDLDSRSIIKKWQNIDESWLDFAMTKYAGTKIATKTNLLLIKVWNFITFREEACFYGFDSYSFCFSGNGCYLACGAKSGEEIARIWDIKNQKYGIFKNKGSNNNFHTVVHLTSPDIKRLICCSVNQNPIVFDPYNQEKLYECECPYKFNEIYEIQSDLLYNIFIVKGKDEENRNVGIMYKLSNGDKIEIFDNYSVLGLTRNNGYIITKCENINGGKLCSININNMNEWVYHDFQIQTRKCKLLNDNKTAIIEYGDESNKEIYLINIENGNFIGKITFLKTINRNSSTCITVNPYEKMLCFRYFEFLSPKETAFATNIKYKNIGEENNE